MLVLVQFLTTTLMMMMMKSAAASDPITVSAQSGETVLLSSDQRGWRVDDRSDVRWTHRHLVLSLKSNVTTCDHGRCELLRNGSLRFSPVHIQDSGNYSQKVFDRHGNSLMRTNFLLRVEGESPSNMSLLIGCLLLLGVLLVFIIIIIIFTLRKRFPRTRTAGPNEENVYVSMHSYHSNKTKDDKQQEKEEESAYVPCNPAVSTETPITKQTSLEAEDIYV